jgi:hypothetical protein
MPLKELLGDRHVLDRDDAAARIVFEDAVDEN